MKDRCMVCMERTIFSEINLDAPDRTPRSCVSYVLTPFLDTYLLIRIWS
jgi:hypothetical protein